MENKRNRKKQNNGSIRKVPFSWYNSEGAVEKVMKDPKITDLATEIKYNMKTSDIIDFEKFLSFMITCSNCSFSVINLSYCKIKIKLMEKKNNNLSSVYRLEILDRYITPAYVVCNVRLHHVLHLLHDMIDVIERK